MGTRGRSRVVLPGDVSGGRSVPVALGGQPVGPSIGRQSTFPMPASTGRVPVGKQTVSPPGGTVARGVSVRKGKVPVSGKPAPPVGRGGGR
jgi:hypothetical protein